MPNLNLTILIDKATLNVFNYIKKEKKTYIRTLYVRNHQYAPRVWSHFHLMSWLDIDNRLSNTQSSVIVNLRDKEEIFGNY